MLVNAIWLHDLSTISISIFRQAAEIGAITAGQRAARIFCRISNPLYFRFTYDSRFKKVEARMTKLKAERDEHSAGSRMIESFIDEMLNAPLILTE